MVLTMHFYDMILTMYFNDVVLTMYFNDMVYFFFWAESYGIRDGTMFGLVYKFGLGLFWVFFEFFSVGLDSGSAVIYWNFNTNLLFNKWILGVFMKCFPCGVFL